VDFCGLAVSVAISFGLVVWVSAAYLVDLICLCGLARGDVLAWIHDRRVVYSDRHIHCVLQFIMGVEGKGSWQG
jgi:hypothetical protein